MAKRLVVLEERVSKLQELRNIPTDVLLSALEIDHDTFYKYLSGTEEINGQLLIKLAKLLNTSINYLLGDTDVYDFDKQTNKELLSGVTKFTINGKEITEEQYEKLNEIFNLLLEEKK